ncbi:ChaN family lipoprotein [Capnocytophaga sp. ARDL2]|uniref:ChaN family lipoprotein n=1 Tax=Capnocytophaga sp. ARDL2 TaxID=3238809 RepID=UPI003559206F
MKALLTIYFLLLTFFGFSQEKKAFELYDAIGKKVSYYKMMKQLEKQDVVFFGEFHNNTLVHWLQLQVLKDLSNKRLMRFGLEMFERDQQEIINRYLNDEINEKAFDTLTRFWSNYSTDYHPMVNFAKEQNIPVIATNVPRKYANMLFKQGEEILYNLPSEEKQWIAPLPFPFDAELSSYIKMLDMFENETRKNLNFPKAQAIKDATMAYSIVENWKPNSLFFHINGSFHTNHYEGIIWYVNHYNPNLKIKSITVVEVDDISTFNTEDKLLADYIFYIPSDMIKSY